MKKNGYTLIELLVLVGILGIAMFVIISKTSFAFQDNKEELYENQKNLILRQAKEFGGTLENLKADKEAIVMVSELIEYEYLAPNSDDKYIDVRNGNDISNLKIKLVYNEEDESITASIIE